LLVAAVALFAAAGAGTVAAPGQAVAELRGDAILDHLNAVIDWYRHALTRVQTVGLPSDAMYQFNAQSMASEAAQLAFQSAQAEALLIPAATPASASAGETTSQQSIAKLQSDADARISALKAQISALDQQIPGARKAKLQDLTAQKERAQGELELRNAMRDAIDQMAKFINTNGESSTGGLEGSISELRRSAPELANANAAKTVVKPASAPDAMPASAGLIGEVVAVYEQLQAMHQISLMLQENRPRAAGGAATQEPASSHSAGHHSARAATGRRLRYRARPNANCTGTIATGAASRATSAVRPDAPAIRPPGRAIQANRERNAPLSQEIILLQQSSSNYLQWRQSIAHESNVILRSIFLRVVSIAFAIASFSCFPRSGAALPSAMSPMCGGGGSFSSCAGL